MDDATSQMNGLNIFTYVASVFEIFLCLRNFWIRYLWNDFQTVQFIFSVMILNMNICNQNSNIHNMKINTIRKDGTILWLTIR